MLLVSQRLDAPRMEPLVPGSVKRTLDMADGPCSPAARGGAKRPCLQDVTLAMDPSYENPCLPAGPRVRDRGRPSQGGNMDLSYSMPTKVGLGLPVNMTVGETPSCMPPPSVEQELQDILEELTRNPNRSLPELDLEKILGSKGDDLLGDDGAFVHSVGDGTPKRSPQGASPLESPRIQSAGFIRAPATSSPQLTPSQPGALFSLTHPAKPLSQPQSPACSPMSSPAHCNLPNSRWHEVPHAQQLQAPPYQPDKLASPALVPPPFSPQNSQASLLPSTVPSSGQQQSATHGFGPHCRGGSQLLKAAMRVGQSVSTGGAEPYSFNNTTPLRHFDPDPSIPRPGHVRPGQGSSGHYGTPNLQLLPPAGLAVNTPTLPLQQGQRSLEPGGAAPCIRGDQSTGGGARFQDPTSLRRPMHGDGYSLLKSQLRKQLMQQEKQRHPEQMSAGHLSDCQQVAPFQGVSRSRAPGLGYPMEPSDPPVVSHNAILPGRMLPEGSHAQTNHSMATFVASMGTKQAAGHPPREFVTPVRLGQAVMGLNTPPQQIAPHCQTSGRAQILGPSFNGRSMQPPMPQQQLPRAPTLQGGSAPCGVLSPQQQPCVRPLWQQQGCPRTVCSSHVDPGSHQHLYSAGGAAVSGTPFSPQSLRPGMPSIPHQNGPFSLSQVPNRQARHPSSSDQHGSGPRGLMSPMGAMKPCPSLALAPIGCPSTPSLGYSSGSSGCKLRPYEFPHPAGTLAQGSNGRYGMHRDEANKVDFIDMLVGSSDNWLNNFNMIDKYLEQNT
ncbi:mastermind-like domain-containing protein 1 [Brienomyrus brachyistius]|uniref:mastermind-like domain-containing protein 1 n=1 Tax=Brienomyrus brachyistius TaxID=42636 RepID=UPI0020B28996|nr:mastermind-like domain-containing protein 1 [Brienomyrus brachyistius]XP_048885375.1 mastermind-like domain-containing protein 1 [Brienomyrus brachyistius]